MPKKDSEDKDKFKISVVEESSEEKTIEPDKIPEPELPKVKEVTSEPSKEDVEKESVSTDNNSDEEEIVEEKPEQPAPAATPSPSGGNSVSFMGIFVSFTLSLILGALLVGGIFYFKSSVDSRPEPTSTPTSTLAPVVENDPTPTPISEEVDLSEYNLRVLNGSGIAGEAGRVANLLSEAGFSNPNAANANNQNYTDTIIEHKETVSKAAIDEIVSALEDTYTVEISNELIDEDEEYDVVVIVGVRSEE